MKLIFNFIALLVNWNCSPGALAQELATLGVSSFQGLPHRDYGCGVWSSRKWAQNCIPLHYLEWLRQVLRKSTHPVLSTVLECPSPRLQQTQSTGYQINLIINLFVVKQLEEWGPGSTGMFLVGLRQRKVQQRPEGLCPSRNVDIPY